MTTTGEVLKPCGHCGFVDVALCRYENKMWAVECEECGASTKQHHRDDLAIAAWNRRSAPQGNAAQEGYVLAPTRATDEMRMYGQSAYDHAVATMPALANRTVAIATAYAAMIHAAQQDKGKEIKP